MKASAVAVAVTLTDGIPRTGAKKVLTGFPLATLRRTVTWTVCSVEESITTMSASRSRMSLGDSGV